MTTIVYPNAKNERPPVTTTVELATTNAREVGARAARALRQPIRPRPLWEREDLFQEPVYADGLALLEDEDDEDD